MIPMKQINNLIYNMNSELKKFSKKLSEDNRRRFLGHIETHKSLMWEVNLSEAQQTQTFKKTGFTGSIKDHEDYINYFYYLGELYMSDDNEAKLKTIVDKYKKIFNELTQMEVR